MGILPYKNKIVVHPIYDPDTTPSGLIYIPEVAKGRCEQGIVAMVGDGVEDIVPGDHVIFSGYSGTTVRVDGIIYIMVPKDFVTARLETSDVDVPGLYFKAKDGTFFNATRDMSLRLICDALKHKQVSDKLTVNELARPDVDDYERM
jgi:co-chaperonin GroES (HSP10)